MHNQQGEKERRRSVRRLTVVVNLQKTRARAIEKTSREPVHQDMVELTITCAHAQLTDMIRLLQLTGM